MLRLLFVASACAVLAVACATTPTLTAFCLPMKTYTAAQQQAVAAQLATLAPDSPVAGMIVDYGQMRAANRACIASQPR